MWSMIVALAGRRVDPPDTEASRFPRTNVGLVRAGLRALFLDTRATSLVSSGACGADLLAMEVAGPLGLRRRMVLPFERDDFRESSVVDRPGDWGALFDRIADEVAARGDLIILGRKGEPEAAYEAVSVAILDEAERLASEAGPAEPAAPGAGVLAVVVWDGRSRGPGDITEAFQRRALERGLRVVEVPTLGGGALP
jgi:hypothetical protein